jgi:hypothetical protein
MAYWLFQKKIKNDTSKKNKTKRERDTGQFNS